MQEPLSRPPRPGLRPFVKTLWASDQMDSPRAGGADRERVLPTGEDADSAGRTLGHAIVGGVRASFYVKDVSEPVRSVGAQLHPGASTHLFGAPAGELAGRHTPLEDLWGAFAAEARGRLVE